MKNILIAITLFSLICITYFLESKSQRDELEKEQFIKNLTAEMNETYPDINKPLVYDSFAIAKK